MRSFLKRSLLMLVGLIPWIAAAALSIWVFEQHVPASGIRQIDVPLDGQSPWFEAFLPGQRATGMIQQKDGWTGQRITDEPVYARLRSPGAYDQLQLGLTFRPVNQPLIELGTGLETDEASIDLKPAWSEVLSHGFHPVTVQGQHGFVRDGLADETLVKASPEATLFWRATSTAIEQMDTLPKNQHYQVSLRGTHDFYVVPVNGQIQFTFQLQDSNRSTEGHSIVFRLMRDQDLLWSEAVGTTGERALHPEAVFEKKVSFNHLAAGVYRLSFLADDGLFIRGFSTTARHWVLGPRVYFGDEIGYSTTTPSILAWTNSRHLEAKTLHREGLQTIGLGTARTIIQQTHTAFPLSRKPEELAGNVEFKALKGDLWIVGDGYLSFDREALFLPYPRRLTDASDPVREGIQAIVTPYVAPQALENGWYQTQLTTPLDPTQARVRLVLSAPGILARQGEVDVRELSLKFQRPPRTEAWWSYLWTEIRSALRRLRHSYV